MWVYFEYDCQKYKAKVRYKYNFEYDNFKLKIKIRKFNNLILFYTPYLNKNFDSVTSLNKFIGMSNKDFEEYVRKNAIIKIKEKECLKRLK